MERKETTSVIKQIAGKWSFNEDFGIGNDTGFAVFKVIEDKIYGKIKVTEQIEGDAAFVVEHQIEGHVEENQFSFCSVRSEVLYSIEHIDYELDEWEGTLTQEGRIVGSSMDDQGTCGVFVMEKISDDISEL
ncbi:hypothetical protein K5X82_02860 [Halosquirtibacter xylanolyticus]|uniref:hypothetical protein n=1 Tax=Halosquirtibacter xylanolyticus TaxID=3374599 RepID=UPI00374912D8|nr:hypothetical protein K5X82_02860 [Prolixibacteraceae bacterium]